MGTVFQGMAFGAGSEVAHQAIRGVTGGGHSGAPVQQQAEQIVDNGQQANQNNVASNACTMENTNFVECLKFHTDDIQACQQYLSALKQCESGNKMSY